METLREILFGKRKKNIATIALNKIRTLKKIVKGVSIYQWDEEAIRPYLGGEWIVDVSGGSHGPAFSFVIPSRFEDMDMAMEHGRILHNESLGEVIQCDKDMKVIGALNTAAAQKRGANNASRKNQVNLVYAGTMYDVATREEHELNAQLEKHRSALQPPVQVRQARAASEALSIEWNDNDDGRGREPSSKKPKNQR